MYIQGFCRQWQHGYNLVVVYLNGYVHCKKKLKKLNQITFASYLKLNCIKLAKKFDIFFSYSSRFCCENFIIHCKGFL